MPRFCPFVAAVDSWPRSSETKGFDMPPIVYLDPDPAAQSARTGRGLRGGTAPRSIDRSIKGYGS